MPRPIAVLLLVICTLLWGIAFVFQKAAMAHMGPLTFTAIRYIGGAVLLLPFAIPELRARRAAVGPLRLAPHQWWQLLALVLSFFAGVWLQQAALQTATVTNGGFLTALYVIFTPLVGFALFRARPHAIAYLGAPMALVGIYLLTGVSLGGFSFSDGLLVLGAVGWAIQIAVLAPLVKQTGLPVALSALTFLVTGLLALAGMPLLEHPTWEGISASWIEILYTTVFSTSIAFTLQAIGQRYVPPANAAIILSAESLFAAIAGAILLGERLPPLGYLGAGLIFVAILMVEAVPALAELRASAPASDRE
ncbi:MAG: DMT family transporter [Devosia sp.]